MTGVQTCALPIYQRWTGRQVGEFLGCVAGGREISFTSTAVLKIAGGEIVQAWDEMDSAAIVAQMASGVTAEAGSGR